MGFHFLEHLPMVESIGELSLRGESILESSHIWFMACTIASHGDTWGHTHLPEVVRVLREMVSELGGLLMEVVS